MRHTYIEGELEVIDFVKEAAKKFEEDPNIASFTLGEIKGGELLGLRWGLRNDCVLVIRIDELFAPTVFGQVIKKGKE